MQIIDLSHTIHETMPVYPGTAHPKITRPFTIEKDGFAETELTFLTHTGTHMDAPAHILAGGDTLDGLPIDCFAGKACVIDIRNIGKTMIDVDDLMPYQPVISNSDYVLMCSGWSRFWGQGTYFSGYPVLSADAAQWIIRFDLKGFGGDVISVDKSDAADFVVHKTLMEKNLVIIENLVNLEQVADRPFNFFCMPLKFEKADGSPVRAFAVVEL